MPSFVGIAEAATPMAGVKVNTAMDMTTPMILITSNTSKTIIHRPDYRLDCRRYGARS